jgi:hypothetical protein
VHGLLGAGEAEPCHLGLSQLLSGKTELSIEAFFPFIKGPTYDFFVTERRNFQNSSLLLIGLTFGTVTGICHAFLWSWFFGHPDPLGRGPDPSSSSKINKKNI